MVNCSDCGREISERARTCPGCGAPGPAAGQIVIATGGPVPEGVVLADWGARAGAFVIDAIIVGGALFLTALLVFTITLGAASSGFSLTPAAAGGAFAALLLFLVWAAAILYKPLMEGSRGATLGKMMLGLKVVEVETGVQITYGKAFLRAIVAWLIGLVPFGFFVDVLWPLWDERNQTLHDKAAGTLVVRA